MHAILASHFRAAAILSLIVPVALLAAVAVYWAVLLRRREAGARSGKVE